MEKKAKTTLKGFFKEVKKEFKNYLDKETEIKMSDSDTFVAAVEATEQEVRDLANKKWKQADCPEGDGVDFWLEAEKELLK